MATLMKEQSAAAANRLTGALGAEITGIDLGATLSDEQKRFIRQSLADHLVVYFRGTPMSPENHVELSRFLGPDEPIPHLVSREDFPTIQFIRTEADTDKPYVVGEAWHSDSTYLPSPPGGIVMRAVKLPPVGGDTLFANMYTVFETLSPKLKDILRSLNAVHSPKRVFGSQSKSYDPSTVKKMAPEAGDKETVHPAVCRHHLTGREYLNVNPVYTMRFEEMTEDESAGLLAHLYAHTALPQFQCRVSWQPDQVLIWDNRAAQHRAVPDYLGEARYLERSTFGAPAPN